MEFAAFRLCPLLLVMSLGATEKSLAPHQVFIHMDKIPISIFFSSLNSPISLSFLSHDR